jgi:hypothetical protein
MLELWWQVVRTYNRGRLTKYEDKFIAMAGIAKEIQVFLKDKYIAGLWGKHLLHTILPGLRCRRLGVIWKMTGEIHPDHFTIKHLRGHGRQ